MFACMYVLYISYIVVYLWMIYTRVYTPYMRVPHVEIERRLRQEVEGVGVPKGFSA